MTAACGGARGLSGLVLVLLLTAIALTPARTEAADAEIRAANQLETYYSTELEESVLDDRLDVDITYDRFSAGIVFLSHTPSNYNLLDPNDFGPPQSGIRKRWIEAEYGPIKARLGDSYASFGSGLVLRIFEDQAVDFDNVVDGAWFQAEVKGFTIEGIAGERSIDITDAPRDSTNLVKGLSIRRQIASGWTVGLNGALIDWYTGDVPEFGRHGLGGIEANGLLPGGVSVTAEYAIRHFRPEAPGTTAPADGHAGYATVSGTAGPLTLFLEGKDLLRFKHPYTTPPTAIRQHTSTLLNRGSHVPNIRIEDERGFQAEGIFNAGSGVTLTGNYSASDARHADLPAWEMFGEIESTDFLGTHLIGRAAETEETIIEGGDRVFFERITFGGEGQIVEGDWSFDATFETQTTQQQNLSRADFEAPLEYRDHIVGITLTRAPMHSWGATFEWTDNDRELKDSWLWIEWNIRLGLIGQLTLAGGAVRGGQVCSGGVCRIMDPFEGGRIELLTNF